jgi:hypothetical protein
MVAETLLVKIHRMLAVPPHQAPQSYCRSTGDEFLLRQILPVFM